MKPERERSSEEISNALLSEFDEERSKNRVSRFIAEDLGGSPKPISEHLTHEADNHTMSFNQIEPTSDELHYGVTGEMHEW